MSHILYVRDMASTRTLGEPGSHFPSWRAPSWGPQSSRGQAPSRNQTCSWLQTPLSRFSFRTPAAFPSGIPNSWPIAPPTQVRAWHLATSNQGCAGFVKGPMVPARNSTWDVQSYTLTNLQNNQPSGLSVSPSFFRLPPHSSRIGASGFSPIPVATPRATMISAPIGGPLSLSRAILHLKL